MMTARKGILFFVLLLCQWVCAQQDSIFKLEQVVVSDMQLKNFSNTQSVQRLNDSVLRENGPSFTNLLRYNSVIYFKENGPGMVSSPSFRGTSAQQTAVVWNGININSQFNGQTDFNTINTKDFDNIAIRAGGGSVLYGSSAIGGSVHLNNDLTFGKHLENTFSSEFGSFNTTGINYNVKYGNENFSAEAGVSHNSSDNDFEFPSGRDNLNGQYYNASINASFGYKINKKNLLKFYNYAFNGVRHFSLISPSDTKTKYHDVNTRNMLELNSSYGKFISKTRLAFVTEKYQYFEMLDAGASNYAKAETLIVKYDAAYNISPGLLLNGVTDFTQTKGTGSDVGDNTRHIGSVSILLKHEIEQKFRYEIGIRKEMTGNYESPLLFSAGMACVFNKYYTLKWNGSRNFRIPTFNDLYWLDGGNRGLKPESSFQTEIGNEIRFDDFTITLTGYLININDMIQWLPGTNASWFPQNVNKVRTYGIESTLNWNKKINNHNFALAGTYAYTVSKNQFTGYQLIYVPYHKMTGSLAWSWKKITAATQLLFNGDVFTRSDNNPRYNIDAYAVSNISAGCRFGKSDWMQLGARVLNVFDEDYQVVEGRPFPGRHYQMYLTLNF